MRPVPIWRTGSDVPRYHVTNQHHPCQPGTRRPLAWAAAGRHNGTDPSRPADPRAAVPTADPARPAADLPADPATGAVPAVLLTPPQAARALNVSERKLRDLTAPRGPIPAGRGGRMIRFRVETLRDWAAALETQPAAA